MDHNPHPFRIAKLSSFARDFATAFFAEFPDWQRNAQLFNPDPFQSEPYEGYELLVRITSPYRNDAERLLVSTDSSLHYVIVGIGPGSAELADWHGDCGSDEVFSEAIQLVRDIMAGTFIGVQTDDGASGLVRREQIRDREDIRKVVSWNGEFDQS